MIWKTNTWSTQLYLGNTKPYNSKRPNWRKNSPTLKKWDRIWRMTSKTNTTSSSHWRRNCSSPRVFNSNSSRIWNKLRNSLKSTSRIMKESTLTSRLSLRINWSGLEIRSTICRSCWLKWRMGHNAFTSHISQIR
jgi:hypothetical protein